jgi:KDO2-lipid IV(A) lauroyltransferase
VSRVKYGIEWLMTFVLHRLIAYRLGVVRENIQRAFPDTPATELEERVKAYYRYLAKTIRQVLVPQSGALIKKRMPITPYQGIEDWLASGKSVIVAMGHVGNWEWAGSSVGFHYPDQVCALYKKIKSGFVNRLMKRVRSSHVNYLVEISQIGELLRLMKRKPVLVLMIADQNPGSDKGIIWSSFFGRDTAFVNGPETLALKYKLPVVYLHVESVGRWDYQLRFEVVYDGEETVVQGEITERFARALESNIRAYPAEWLWSHRRWKRIKPSNG